MRRSDSMSLGTDFECGIDVESEIINSCFINTMKAQHFKARVGAKALITNLGQPVSEVL